MTEIVKPTERPRWASDVSADVITPSGAKQNTGWVQEYPPLQFFNWLGKFTYQWLDYLEKHTDASLGGGGELVAIEIAAGVLLPVTGNHRIDTEGSGATDDLTNINISNLADGRILILRSTSAARVITVKHAAGGSYPINLRNSADIVLDDPRKALVLIRNGNQWNELFGFLGSDPAPYLSADLDVQAKKITTTTVNEDVIVEPNGTGSLSPLTTGKALGKSAQRWNAFLSGANVAGDISPEADGTRALGSTGTRWGSTFADQISATDWVRTAALDTESGGGTLAIGGTNASVINIGRTGATVALLGSITNVHTTNTFVTDKLITLNDGGLATSGDGAGIEIEEGGSATAYLKVSSNRNKWSFKAPNDAAVVSIGAEATVVGDIGLVSSVFTFMSNGFSFKNSAGTVIGSATDAGEHTWGTIAGSGTADLTHTMQADGAVDLFLKGSSNTARNATLSMQAGGASGLVGTIGTASTYGAYGLGKTLLANGGVGVALDAFGANGGITFYTGGVGTLRGTIDKDGLWTIPGVVSVTDATDATSGATGAIHTDGGLGVAKSLFVGTMINVGSTSTNSVDPIVNVKLTRTSASNSHCFTDSCTYSKPTHPGPAYGWAFNSFDARCVVSGSSNVDHYAAFQSDPNYSGFSAILKDHFSLWTHAIVGDGATITNYHGAYFATPAKSGSGAITNEFGIYIENQTAGTNKYPIYSLGTGTSRFAGDISFAAGKGIDFSETTNSAVTGVVTTTEILTAFSAGSFTPEVKGTSTAGAMNPTGVVKTGVWTRIGLCVFYQIYVKWTDHSGAGNMKITGLPWTARNTDNLFAQTAMTDHVGLTIPASSVMYGIVTPNTTEIVLYSKVVGAAAGAALALDTAAEIWLTGFYQI